MIRIIINFIYKEIKGEFYSLNAVKFTSIIRPELLSKLSELVRFAANSREMNVFAWNDLLDKNEIDLTKHFENILKQSVKKELFKFF